MDKTHTLIIGAGITGLSFANFTTSDDYMMIEANHEIGGYCRTVKQDGFVWDYSGHFFHFRHPEIEAYLTSRMPAGEIHRVVKNSQILFKNTLIDFPFQKNIHQLPQADFIDCLYDLYFREENEAGNFREMLYAKFGRGICERFLIPYNEKLYACELSKLDKDAMGRFFPYADLTEIIANFKKPDNSSYNSTFTYPKGGAIEYIKALKMGVPNSKIHLNERLVKINLEHRVAHTNQREIAFQKLVSSAPFNQLLKMTGIQHDPGDFTSNKVLVFNLGFDKKGLSGIHWIYFPERKYCFYRVGFYDNIFESDRMSLYVEIGMPTDASVNTSSWLKRVIHDLKEAGIITDHQLVSYHSVVLDPAYVHITKKSQAETRRLMDLLNPAGIYSIGRYGGWKYCAIEDNIVEARALVEKLEGRTVSLELQSMAA
jgi:protoporphyrinogen oxidase